MLDHFPWLTAKKLAWILPGLETEVPSGPDMPGGFGYCPAKSCFRNTGVHLYAPTGHSVVSIESGRVLDINPWRGDDGCVAAITNSVLIKGEIGIFLYDGVDLSENVKIGARVGSGTVIGSIRQPHNNHENPHVSVEQYVCHCKHWGPAGLWYVTHTPPLNLVDPTKFLEAIREL